MDCICTVHILYLYYDVLHILYLYYDVLFIYCICTMMYCTLLSMYFISTINVLQLYYSCTVQLHEAFAHLPPILSLKSIILFPDMPVNFQVVRMSMLTPENNDRPEAPNVVLLITDGESDDRALTFRNAAALRATGATVLTVAVGIRVRVVK